MQSLQPRPGAHKRLMFVVTVLIVVLSTFAVPVVSAHAVGGPLDDYPCQNTQWIQVAISNGGVPKLFTHGETVTESLLVSLEKLIDPDRGNMYCDKMQELATGVLYTPCLTFEGYALRFDGSTNTEGSNFGPFYHCTSKSYPFQGNVWVTPCTSTTNFHGFFFVHEWPDYVSTPQYHC